MVKSKATPEEIQAWIKEHLGVELEPWQMLWLRSDATLISQRRGKANMGEMVKKYYVNQQELDDMKEEAKGKPLGLAWIDEHVYLNEHMEPKDPNWLTIPEHPKYEINKKGIVRNIESGHILHMQYDPKDKQAGLKVGVRVDGKRVHIAPRAIAKRLFPEVWNA